MIDVGALRGLLREASTGPWELDKYRGKCRRRINSPGWESMAKVVTRLKGSVDEYPEGVANAKLMAASREIAEAAIAYQERSVRLTVLLTRAVTLLKDVETEERDRLLEDVARELVTH